MPERYPEQPTCLSLRFVPMNVDETPQGTAFPWLDFASAVFSGVAALGGVVALLIAIRALVVSRESVAVDQLFAAFSELIASLQEIGRTGTRLGLEKGGESRSRERLNEKFQRFDAARARVDLATESLGIRGPYTESVLNLANNFAAGVLQANEFGPLARKRMAEQSKDTSWVSDLTWEPSPSEIKILARSISFEDVRDATELVDKEAVRLRGLDEWWGRRITDQWAQSGRSVYSIKSSCLVQTSRLLEDFTREYIQPMCETALRSMAGSKRKSRPLE